MGLPIVVRYVALCYDVERSDTRSVYSTRIASPTERIRSVFDNIYEYKNKQYETRINNRRDNDNPRRSNVSARNIMLHGRLHTIQYARRKNQITNKQITNDRSRIRITMSRRRDLRTSVEIESNSITIKPTKRIHRMIRLNDLDRATRLDLIEETRWQYGQEWVQICIERNFEILSMCCWDKTRQGAQYWIWINAGKP